MRTYRVSRMQDVTALAIGFKRPANFDLAAFWEASTKQLQQQRQHFDAMLALDPQAARSISQWCATSLVRDKKKRTTPEGWLTLRVEFENQEQARFVTLGFGPKAQALAPASLCDRILADASAIVDRGIG
jgi:predicted DNA-binding transcriptional regulator YafY